MLMQGQLSMRRPATCPRQTAFWLRPWESVQSPPCRYLRSLDSSRVHLHLPLRNHADLMAFHLNLPGISSSDFRSDPELQCS